MIYLTLQNLLGLSKLGISVSLTIETTIDSLGNDIKVSLRTVSILVQTSSIPEPYLKRY